jgi:nucleolin
LDQSEDDDEEESDSDDSDSSEEESEESEPAGEKPAAAEKPSKKRKAEEEPEAAEASSKKTKSDAEASDKSATLWVGNLGWGVDDNALYEEFQNNEGIVGARVVTDKDSGRSRGFGYVDFDSPEAAEKAYNDKNGAFLQGRDMRLDFASKPSADSAAPNARAADRARKHGDVISPESDTLFVGNLPFSADEESVSNFFNEVAQVQSLRIPTDQ